MTEDKKTPKQLPMSDREKYLRQIGLNPETIYLFWEIKAVLSQHKIDMARATYLPPDILFPENEVQHE